MRDYAYIALIGPMTTYGFIGGLVTPLMLYLVARWRAHRDAIVDPQLGLKVVLAWFGFIAFEVVLAGTTVLLWAMFTKMDSPGDLYRAAFGMIVPGAIVLAAHAALLRKTNDAQFPGVRRLVLGCTLVITGLTGFAGLVLAFQALFMKGSSGELGPVSGAMVVVFGSAWAIVGWQFGKQVLGTFGAPPPANVVMPPAPAQTPTLPSLGGGSYPPIDKT